MNRVPINTFDRFEKIANTEDFCNDRGMALKMILDFYEGLVPVGDELIRLELDGMKKDIEQLKQQSAQKEEKKDTIKTVDGGEKVK